MDPRARIGRSLTVAGLREVAEGAVMKAADLFAGLGGFTEGAEAKTER
jgi:hypothetical protein